MQKPHQRLLGQPKASPDVHRANTMTMRSAAPQTIASRILTIRGHRVMLDADLADLYDVPTKALVQAVKRNPERFPRDFMFQLTEQEVRALKSQSVTLPEMALRYWGRRRKAPYAFSEQGVAMLSSVLQN